MNDSDESRYCELVPNLDKPVYYLIVFTNAINNSVIIVVIAIQRYVKIFVFAK